MSSDKKTIYTGASDGTVTCWEAATGANQRIAGNGHGAQIIAIRGEGEGQLLSYPVTRSLKLNPLVFADRSAARLTFIFTANTN